MKKLIINKAFVFSALFLLIPLLGSSQTILWTETFDPPGVWTTTITGSEGADPNFWAIGDGEGGVTPPGCGVANNGNNTLHITSVFNPTGGAAYDAGGLCGFLFCPETNRRTESPTINLTGNSGMTLSFDYIENGSGVIDNATLWYFDGVSWSQLDDMPKTPLACAPQGQWTSYSIALPASADNNPNVRIGFRWVNNDDGVGTDPSIAINDIEISVPSSPPPTANFTASDTMICEGTCISFTDSSTNTPTSWEWSFPGATPDTSNDQNPVNICYSAPGNYTVTLVATNGSGSDDTTMTNYIIVDTAATAYAGLDTNICDTGSYTITGATIGGSATSLLWTTSGDGTFDDSSLISAAYTPSTADTAAGCVTLTITTNDPAGSCLSTSDSMALCFFSCAAPVANFTASDTTICEGICINFTDLSVDTPTTWMWYFPGGTPDTSTAQNPDSICFATAGTYTISLVAANANGQDSLAKVDYITVTAPPVADFTASNTTICVGDSVDFTDLSANSPTGWFWVFSGGTPGTSPSQNPSAVYYNTPGAHSVTLNATNTCGSDDTTFTGYITVQTVPVADFTASNTTICESACINFTDSSTNNPTTWFWFFSGASPPNTSPDQNPDSICYPAAGSYDVVLNTTNACGSGDTTMTSYITVNVCTAPPVADFTASDTIICEGNCINFTDSSANTPTSWEWSFPGAVPDTSNIQSPANICYDTSGSYDVMLIVSNANGTDTLIKSIYITVNPSPTVNLGPDLTICPGDSVLLDAGGGFSSYLWQDGSANQTFIADTSGIYYVEVTDSNGCTASDTVVVSFGASSSVNLVPDSSFENYSCIPDGLIQNYLQIDTCLIDWFTPTDASPDYYHTNSTNFSNGVPINFYGFQNTSTGNAYGGIYTLVHDSSTQQCPHYREYYRIQLSSPLVVGQQYYAEMNVVLAKIATHATNNLGMLFTTVNNTNYGFINFCDGSTDAVINAAPQVNATSVILDTVSWITISDTFTADSAYQYLTIGNFFDDNNTTIVSTGVPPGFIGPDLFYEAYYYIDDVYVRAVDSCTVVCLVPLPPGPITGTASLCIGTAGENYSISPVSGAISYTWTVPAGAAITSGQGTTSITVDWNSISGNVCVTADNTCGSSTPTCRFINVNPLPTVNLGPDTVFCIGDSAVLDAGGGFTDYLWQDSSTKRTLTVFSAGTYSVEVTDTNGCKGTDTVNVSVTSLLPSAKFVYSDSNLTINFTDSSKNTTEWLWDFGDGDTDTIQNPVHTYASAGTYNVCLTAGNICDSNTFCDSITVTCIPPKADFSFEDVLLSVMFSDSSDYATNWYWDFGDGNTNTLQNPTHTYNSAGTYNVCLIARNACFSDTTCDSITVNQLFIPTAFSPNADGVNDVFRITGSGITKIYLAVYDRWGVRVFETEDIKEATETGWDGKYKGKEQGMAVFVYYVEVDFVDGTSDTRKGDVTLIR